MRYQYGGTSGDDDDVEPQDTSKEGEGYNKFAFESETCLRNGAFPVSSVRLVYISVNSSMTDERIAELYEKVAKHVPVTFVPIGYHGRSVAR